MGFCILDNKNIYEIFLFSFTWWGEGRKTLKDQAAWRRCFFWQISCFESNGTGNPCHLLECASICHYHSLMLHLNAWNILPSSYLSFTDEKNCFTWLRSSSESYCHEMANVALERHKWLEDNCENFHLSLWWVWAVSKITLNLVLCSGSYFVKFLVSARMIWKWYISFTSLLWTAAAAAPLHRAVAALGLCHECFYTRPTLSELQVCL